MIAASLLFDPTASSLVVAVLCREVFGARVWDVGREPRPPPACYQGSVAMHHLVGGGEWEFAITQYGR